MDHLEDHQRRQERRNLQQPTHHQAHPRHHQPVFTLQASMQPQIKQEQWVVSSKEVLWIK